MVEKSMVDVIVLGGGPAGVTAALRARELGAQVVLVEKDRLGGACTNDGCVPTRVLAKTARLIREAEQFHDFGLEGKAPTPNFAEILNRASQTVETVHQKKQIEKHLAQAGVKTYTGTGNARFIDEHTIAFSDSTQIVGDKIIICAGGHARRFPFPGSEFAIDHHDVWSMKKFPESIAIVGGAATGCQLASIFAAFGSRVTLLEVSPTILGREDRKVAEVMSQLFKDRNIEIINGISGVRRIEKSGDKLTLWYGLGQVEEPISVDNVLMAVGWVGSFEELGLSNANVATDRGYIQVNDYQQTSTEHIFAAGDITGRMMLVQSSSYEGRIAAENAVLGVGQPYQHRIVPHGGFTDPEYAGVGLTEEQAREKHEVVVACVDYLNLDRAVVDRHTEGFCKLIVSQETHRVIGAHVVGEQAVEIIQLVAASMAGDMWVEQLAELELAYPTYTAIVGLAAREIVHKLGVLPVAHEWRTLGKPFSAEWEQADR